MPPIYATSTYVQSSPGCHKGYDYSRTRNPTRDALQAAVANLEGGAAGFAFASGMATTATCSSCSMRLAHRRHARPVRRQLPAVRERPQALGGPRVSFVDLSKPAALEAAIRPDTRMVWVETPTNPLLKLVDLSATARVARKRGVLSVCDNTFATPFLQRPLEHGFDIVVHSATKYLNGHSDASAVSAWCARDRISPSASRTCRTRWALYPARSTPSWSCGASRPLRCAWSGTAPMRCRSRSSWSNTRRSSGCTTRDWKAIRNTRLAAADGGRLRRDRHRGTAWRRASRAAHARALPAVRACREFGRSREPDRAPGQHDACIDTWRSYEPRSASATASYGCR
jgi:hypothetical protein